MTVPVPQPGRDEVVPVDREALSNDEIAALVVLLATTAVADPVDDSAPRRRGHVCSWRCPAPEASSGHIRGWPGH